MPTFNALYSAILVRQRERAGEGSPPMEEMHVPSEMLARVCDEIKSTGGTVNPSTEICLAGVLLRPLIENET